MTTRGWRVRTARNTPKDRALLGAFPCADRSIGWQTEVEAFIRGALFDWAFALRKPDLADALELLLEVAIAQDGASALEALVVLGGRGLWCQTVSMADATLRSARAVAGEERRVALEERRAWGKRGWGTAR